MAADEPDESARARAVRLLSGPRSRLGVTVGPSAAWILTLLVAPLAFMVAVSFFEVSSLTYQIVYEPTLNNYRSLFDGGGAIWNTPFVTALWLSYVIATVTTLLCLTLAFPLDVRVVDAQLADKVVVEPVAAIASHGSDSEFGVVGCPYLLRDDYVERGSEGVGYLPSEGQTATRNREHYVALDTSFFESLGDMLARVLSVLEHSPKITPSR